MSWQHFIGNRHAADILRRAIAQERLPHAMIFAGPSGVGKCTLAFLAAQALNCLEPRDGVPCDHCSACRRILAYVESRNKHCVKGKGSFCGVCPVCQARSRQHPDIRLIKPEDKTIITIEQIRDVINEVAFQPLEARWRVVILDPADQMKAEGQNSLLKTLEEPPSRTVMILIATSPYQLLETIRSRARILHFGEIPRDELIQYLISHEGKTEADALLAAALSGGSLGAALELDSTEYRAIRESALEFVTLLLGRGSFAEVSALSVKVAKDKGFFQTWIELATMLLQDVYYAGQFSERVGQRDLMDQLEALRRQTPPARLVRALTGIDQLKSSLQYNVNRQIALEALFLELSR